MESNRVKSVVTDPRVKNRFRFTSSRKRGKKASADVYRSYKRRIGVTSAASREERVHHPNREESNKKRKRNDTDGKDRSHVVAQKKDSVQKEVDQTMTPLSEEGITDTESTFASELDIALDRNGSEAFGKFHKEIWHLVRSLPEILHHSSKIIDILMKFMLSPPLPSPSDLAAGEEEKVPERLVFQVNHATTDILHLVAVLARDLRHEIHPFVYTKILPRVVNDLLNPPAAVMASTKKPLQPVDVTIVEAAFRTLSYVFRYDTEQLVSDSTDHRKNQDCLEKLRQYYGTTLAHNRDIVRRLAAETYAPLIRRLPSDTSRKRHLRRVLRALAASAEQKSSTATTTINHSLKKLQSNAVDGISLLFFELVRGVSGKLHSKGHVAVKCLLDTLSLNKNKAGSSIENIHPNGQELIYLVSSCLFDQLCEKLDVEPIMLLLDEVIGTTRNLLQVFIDSNSKQSPNAIHSVALVHMIKLLGQLVTAKNGEFLKSHVERKSKKKNFCALEIVQQLMNASVFQRFPESAQSGTLKLLCSIWKAVPDNAPFAKEIKTQVVEISQSDAKGESVSKKTTGCRPEIVLAKDVLPCLRPNSIAVNAIVTTIFSTAIHLANVDVSESLNLISLVAAATSSLSSYKSLAGDDEGINEDDGHTEDRSALKVAALFPVSQLDKQRLLTVYPLDTPVRKLTESYLPRLGSAIRCAPFFVIVGSSCKKAGSRKTLVSQYKEISKLLFRTFSDIVELDYSLEQVGKEDLVVMASLGLESLSVLSMEVADITECKAIVEKNLALATTCAEKHLLSNPRSLWAIKSGSSFVNAAKKVELTLNWNRDAVFDAIIPNLRDRVHLRRLHSLEILSSFPQIPFITDHADLDLADDLDEEPSSHPPTNSLGSKGPLGLCDIILTLLALESTPVALEQERQMLSYIARVETLGRSKKLPIVYAETAANHMLGILYVKLATLWPAAVRALVALVIGQEDHAWPPIQSQLTELMAKPPTKNEERNSFLVKDHVWGSTSESLLWDVSGDSLDIDDISTHDARPHHRLSTDEATVIEFVWSVLENTPQLIVRHSRIIVPVFLSFMKYQYYFYYVDDLDARELRLHEHLEDNASISDSVEREEIDGKTLHRRLLSIMKAFAAVVGPQQLVKNQVLLSLFLSLLGHQEASIGQLALTFVRRFKLVYLNPYAEKLEALFAKGGLKEALMKFLPSDEQEVIPVHREHRRQLLFVLTRILFGRISTRAVVGKSSKDSPAARRSAVLSFLSVFCESNDEYYPFIYLMVRSFLPSDYPMKPVSMHQADTQNGVMEQLTKTRAADLNQLNSAVSIGFLHLLETLVTNLGHRITHVVPQLISIILSLCKAAETKPGSDDSEEVEDDSDTEEATSPDQRKSQGRNGNIRTLCFRRLSEIFSHFATSIDFTIYSGSMIDAIKNSVEMLPAMVVNSNSFPSLLHLVRTLSSHPRLIKMLRECEEIVPSTIKCISCTSSSMVVDAALSFVSNLLTNGEGEHSQNEGNHTGLGLIRQHIGLILDQFTDRLSTKNNMMKTSHSADIKQMEGKKQPTRNSCRRELDILCQVSAVVLTDQNVRLGVESETLEKLCTLLVPFLDLNQGTSDLDKLNILGILNTLLPRISSEESLSHFSTLASLLGPYKGKPGILSVNVRQSLASAICMSAKNCDKRAKKASEVLMLLSTTHAKRVDELNYDTVISALNDLNDIESNSSWTSLTGASSDASGDPSFLSPLIYTCFHYLFDDDGVLCRVSFKALKTLVATAAKQASLLTACSSETPSGENVWIRLLERCIVPATRPGLSTKSLLVRRHFVLLLAEVARNCRSLSNPNLYGDLDALICDDNPDLDFFLNITHVQFHRRARGLQRLRKILNDDAGVGETKSPFSLQSLSNVLLPLATNPVYECNAKDEESFALEAIATIGAISRLLSWSKYSNILWTTLNQFHRKPEQERYLIGMICSIIDGFHFDISCPNGTDQTEILEVSAETNANGSAVWRTLEKRVIPKVEGLLTIEQVDRKGTKVKKLRSSVALALLKLFQKFPQKIFESKLPRLLAVICDALKSRDSDAREVARDTLSKMVITMDLVYLLDVVRELAITLTEGYQLHVRSATIHTILLSVSGVYKSPEDCTAEDALALPFDKSIPALMDLIQQDLFGIASERKEAQGAQVRYVKEAGGAKSIHSIELISALLLFRPSFAATRGDATSFWGIHSVVSPLIERLRLPGIDVRTIRKIRECLDRVVIGLSRNSSVSREEVLPFVYATLQIFVSPDEIAAVQNPMNDDNTSDSDSDSEGESKPLTITGSSSKEVNSKMKGTKVSNVVTWRSSTLQSVQTSKEAMESKYKDQKELHRVKDGASAPKLTGSSRHDSSIVPSAKSVNDPSSISAVAFGLSLLNSALKKNQQSDVYNFSDLADPFIPMLTACVCGCRETEIVILSFKCLGSLLRMELPSTFLCTKSLGSKTLELLSSSGIGSKSNSELSQACFKMLTILISMNRNQVKDESNFSREIVEVGEKKMSNGDTLPLDSDQMKILLSFLQESIVDSDHHNPALGLIKAIVSCRYVSPEFYDLMETLLNLSVRSQKASLRQQSIGIFMTYFLNYPMGPERLEQHLKQIVLNIKYEYEEGRLSAISLLNTTISKVPEPVLEKHTQLFFLPITLQLVNDDSKKCREAVASCLSCLLNRVSTEIVQSLYEYTVRWSQGNESLQRTSLQLFGMFVDSCESFLKRGETVPQLITRLHQFLEDSSLTQNTDWELPYFSLKCLEKLCRTTCAAQFSRNAKLWTAVIDCLMHPHYFVRLASSRLINQHLTIMDACTFAKDKTKNGQSTHTFLIERPESLHEIAKSLCVQLSADEESQSEELSTLAIKSIIWIILAMNTFPRLFCGSKQLGSQNNGKEELEEDNSVLWIMTKLSRIAKPKGAKRRQAIFKCFAALCTKCTSAVCGNLKYLELMLEPLYRVNTETTNEIENSMHSSKEVAPLSFAQEVLSLVEEKCEDSELFVRALMSVKSQAKEKKEKRVLSMKTKAITNPEAAAKKRVQKQEREKKRRKRRVEDRRREHGAVSKRRR